MGKNTQGIDSAAWFGSKPPINYANLQKPVKKSGAVYGPDGRAEKGLSVQLRKIVDIDI